MKKKIQIIIIDGEATEVEIEQIIEPKSEIIENQNNENSVE